MRTTGRMRDTASSPAGALEPTAAPAPRPGFAAGAAFIDGALVPIAGAGIPILDRGLTRSDVTDDVVRVWNGRFFRPGHHLERFDRGLAGPRMRIPHDRGEVVEILTRLMRLTGLGSAHVEVPCARGTPPRDGSHDPRRCTDRFAALAIPFVWIADEERCAAAASTCISARCGASRPSRSTRP